MSASLSTRPIAPTQAERRAMTRALQLAQSVRGRTSPNPAVGAVVLNAGEIVGEGATQPPGGDHAEIVALAQAGAGAAGATLAVTLEPCNHAGRTPACSDAILKAGVARLIVAMRDPNPQVPGGAIERLAAHGIDVQVGLQARAAAAINLGFTKLATTGRPFVTAKWAMTLDGKIARPAGGGVITGPDARAQAHVLRDQTDAVLIGAATARIDDPRLTVRPPPSDGRQPIRIVVDSQARVAPHARVFQAPGLTLIATTERAPSPARRALARQDAEILICAADADGRVDLDNLLDVLGARGIADLLVEGGAALHASLFAAASVDRVVAFIAPWVMGAGVPAVAPGGPDGAGVDLQNVHVRQLGPDLMLDGIVRHADTGAP